MRRKISLLMVMMLTISTMAVALPNEHPVRSNEDSVISAGTEETITLSEVETNLDEAIGSEAIADQISDQINDQVDFIVASLEEYEIEKEFELVEVNKVDEIYYAANDVNARQMPDVESDVVTKILLNDEVHVTGEVTEEDKVGWVQIEIYGSPAYVMAKYLSKEQEERIKYGKEDWQGTKLNVYSGRVTGPNGDETYYNLDMSGIVQMMKNKGIVADYWVREDGVKMYGDYIMVAANLKQFPRGTLVETSLGIGMVCDTGDFVYNGSGVTFDIATTWVLDK